MKNLLIILGFAIVIFGVYYFFIGGPSSGSSTNSVVLTDETERSSDNGREISDEISNTKINDDVMKNTQIQTKTKVTKSSREIRLAESIELPLSGSAPTKNVKHSIPIEEIRRGCFRQDCIPSVDNPEFISINEANDLLPDDTIGVALEYKGVTRFYPFNMLVTREIVNDVVEGDPILMTYCPLCGTGIVFDRRVGGVAQEFGVSGMLWQSNLLMYNRASSVENRNLWSQVLGEAVVGPNAGEKLTIIPSNIVRYIDWRGLHPDAQVLNTGRIGDPYGGDYYGVAQNFNPDFDEANSLLPPTEYVFGVEVDGGFKAYPRDSLPFGTLTDTVGVSELTITKSEDGTVTIVNQGGETVPDIEGFWFSWVAAHPDTSLWTP